MTFSLTTVKILMGYSEYDFLIFDYQLVKCQDHFSNLDYKCWRKGCFVASNSFVHN